jgi:hypothetical protein
MNPLAPVPRTRISRNDDVRVAGVCVAPMIRREDARVGRGAHGATRAWEMTHAFLGKCEIERPHITRK